MKNKKISDKSWLKLIEEFEGKSIDPWQASARHSVMSDFVWFLVEKYGTPAKIHFPQSPKSMRVKNSKNQ